LIDWGLTALSAPIEEDWDIGRRYRYFRTRACVCISGR